MNGIFVVSILKIKVNVFLLVLLIIKRGVKVKKNP